jgi:hypothetical protein
MLQLSNLKRKFRPRLEILEDRTLLSVCTVDRLTDNNSGGGGEGSDLAGDLRYCITNAADGDVISFGKGVTGSINLSGALPDLTHSINIEGPGAGNLTVRRDTGGNYRIFTVGDGTTVSISGLTIANGLVMDPGGRGGGIFISNATVTLDNCIVTGNTARSTSNVAEGGGIYGAATLINSTISNNIAAASNAAGWGGGLYGNFTIVDSTISGNAAREGLGPGDGGGIYGAATVINSTISNNNANFGGGYWGKGGGLTAINSTISGNNAIYLGGGIYGGSNLFNSTVAANFAFDGGGGIYGYATARDTIIAGNLDFQGTAPDLQGGLDSLGHNLIGNSNGGSGFDDTDLVDVKPMLGPLRDNGGPTLTMAPGCSSPAIDAGDNTEAPDWDQRGEGYPRIVNGIVDIGAYEVQKGECGGFAPGGSRIIYGPRPETASLGREIVSSQPSTLNLVPASVERPVYKVVALDRLFASVNIGDSQPVFAPGDPWELRSIRDSVVPFGAETSGILARQVRSSAHALADALNDWVRNDRIDCDGGFVC